MNWLDILLLIVMVGSIASSFRRGFSREVVGLVSSILALFAGLWFYGSVGATLQPYLSSRAVANFCGFVLVFLGVVILGALAGYGIGRFVKAVGLSALDRLLGGFFGLVRGLVISIAIITALVAFARGADGKPPQSVVSSRLAPYLIDAAHILTAVAPKELKEEFAKTYEQVKRIWEQAMEHRVRQLPRSDI